jgi:hypothetical protein
MTRIVLFLTAVPLAAILALVLNRLLERAALGIFATALLTLSLATAAPVAATQESPDATCDSFECSLAVDRAKLDELWTKSQPRKVKLLYQSRIPMTEEGLREGADALMVKERGRTRPPEVSAPSESESPVETLRR